MTRFVHVILESLRDIDSLPSCRALQIKLPRPGLAETLYSRSRSRYSAERAFSDSGGQAWWLMGWNVDFA